MSFISAQAESVSLLYKLILYDCSTILAVQQHSTWPPYASLVHHHRFVVLLQISREELETAMSFLGDQLGEDELRMLLEKLNAYGEAKEGPINVSNLMALAAPGNKQPSASDSQKRDTLAGLSQKV